MPQTSIIAKNVSVTRSSGLLLDDISFGLNQGEHLLITGSSGSGKTTLAKAIAGKIFYKGSIQLKGNQASIIFAEQHYFFKTLSNTNDFYYQQRYNSFDSDDALTVEQELLKITPDETLIDQLLAQLLLAHRKNDSLLHLSSGEHKRFQLIKAFLRDADIFIFDSPFTGLDADSRKMVKELIEQRSSVSTIILIADVEDVPATVTHVAELDGGRLKSFGTIKEFECSSKNRFQPTRFSGSIPLQPDTAEFYVAVKFESVSVSYGEKAIFSNINWQVNRGERWLLKGANGSGKSTLIGLVTGDHPQAYANDIFLFDRKRGSGESIWDIKKKIGFVSPELHWYYDKSISVYNTTASGFFDTVGIYKALDHEQHVAVQQWLSFLNLEAKGAEPLYALSTSEQRLTLLARALVKNPPLLILDEPCQGLDEQQVNEFVGLIDEVCERLNKTLIYVSHYENEIPGCIDKVIFLEDGREKKYSINRKRSAAIAV
ncbi:MAG TPA: ATP-binding cassette domain-containing protein [Chitinophagaceae bacterium]|jgi:molybdate transport system ATP-binding protein|nr:ATP-binding cassette domain-containing protein [Chitinophagaceae bacterium]